MRRFLIYFSVTFICALFASCSFLDREPDFVSPDYYYNTDDEVTKALYGVYNRLIDTNGRMYSKGLFSYFVLSDEFSYTNNFLINNIRHGTFDASNLDIGRLWEILYEGVSRANYLISSLSGKESLSRTQEAALGEAMFMRGYYYFLLTSMFGEVPLKLNPTVDPSEKYIAASSYQSIYESIVNDMQSAESLVMDIDSLGTNERITKTGVEAILARVYLKMAGEPLTGEDNPEKAAEYYNNVINYADKVINSGKHSLNTDYSQIFINHIQNISEPKECIWEVGMYGNKIGSEDLAGSVGVENGILCRDESIGYSGGPMTIQKKLYDSFKEGDTRRDWAIANYYYNYNATTGQTTKIMLGTNASGIWRRNPGKWRRDYELGTKSRNYTATNFPIMRYSDVLLMKAEAINALEGPTSEAYELVNEVRRRAFKKLITEKNAECDLPEGLNKEEFQLELEDERFREFCFEGRRKWDLLRWGKYITTMQELAKSVTETAPAAYQYAARAGNNTTERNILFPIPTTELTVNKLMKQNEGW